MGEAGRRVDGAAWASRMVLSPGEAVGQDKEAGMTTKAGWIVVIDSDNPASFRYCGHKHLSMTTAVRCVERLLRTEPAKRLHIAESIGGR
jgi:hypothetical protein